jgi:hypothetical protein
MTDMITEARLGAIELERLSMAASPAYGLDEDDPGYEQKLDEVFASRMDAIGMYLEKAGEDGNAALITLITELAIRAFVYRMLLLQRKLGHLPTEQEMTADLDQDELGSL